MRRYNLRPSQEAEPTREKILGELEEMLEVSKRSVWPERVDGSAPTELSCASVVLR